MDDNETRTKAKGDVVHKLVVGLEHLSLTAAAAALQERQLAQGVMVIDDAVTQVTLAELQELYNRVQVDWASPAPITVSAHAAWFAQPKRPIKTRDELLDAMRYMGACVESMEFVAAQASDDALTIVKSMDDTEWFLWAAEESGREDLIDQYVEYLVNEYPGDSDVEHWAFRYNHGGGWDRAVDVAQAIREEYGNNEVEWWQNRAEELLK